MRHGGRRQAAMPSYTININIDATGLQTISAGNLAVTLAQPVYSYVATSAYRAAVLGDLASGPAIAWQVFQPVSSNQVVIETDYFLCMTTTPTTYGNVLQINSITDAPVQTGLIYLFQNGQISGPISTEGPTGAYSVQNEAQGQTHTFGLAQGATINGALQPNSMMNATPVIGNSQASFVPQQDIVIFLSSCTSAGTVIPSLPATGLTVPLSSSQPIVNVGFNDVTNTFYLA